MVQLRLLLTKKPSIPFSSQLMIMYIAIEYSMKNKEQTRKLVAGYSKNRFEVADKADVVEEIFEEY